MEWIKDILIIVLPGAIIFATVYFLMKQFFDNQEKLKRLELRKEYSKNDFELTVNESKYFFHYLQSVLHDNHMVVFDLSFNS